MNVRLSVGVISALSLVVFSGAASALVIDSYSTGFESPVFTVGPMSNGVTTQGGWSGGAQPGFQNDNNAIVNSNGSIGDEAITTAAAHSGTQSWRMTRTYNSPGQGTPFSPNLSVGLGDPGVTQFSGNLWFRAVQGADNSSMAIETGTRVGDDRGDYVVFAENVAGGIHLYTFGNDFAQVEIATGLIATDWHQLNFSLTKLGALNSLAVSVDGGAVTTVFPDGLSDFRDDNSFPYADSSRMKFRCRNGGCSAPDTPDVDKLGFYLDDISYSVSNDLTAAPEPGSIALLGLGLAGLGFSRRRKI